jgi:hypothetical protein
MKKCKVVLAKEGPDIGEFQILSWIAPEKQVDLLHYIQDNSARYARSFQFAADHANPFPLSPWGTLF